MKNNRFHGCQARIRQCSRTALVTWATQLRQVCATSPQTAVRPQSPPGDFRGQPGSRTHGSKHTQPEAQGFFFMTVMGIFLTRSHELQLRKYISLSLILYLSPSANRDWVLLDPRHCVMLGNQKRGLFLLTGGAEYVCGAEGIPALGTVQL